MESEELFFTMLRYALDISPQLPEQISAAEWEMLHKVSSQQSMLGVMFAGIKKLPKPLCPPRPLLLQWYSEAERIAAGNRQLSDESRIQSGLFAEWGRQTCILKGQGNARLYPDPLSRAPGDVDIWVEGGRDSVICLLKEKGVKGRAIRHHMEFTSERKVTVEIHFQPASGSFCPSHDRNLQQWLAQEIQHTEEYDGYHVPTARFNRVMQLSHLMRHFITSGVGLRQLTDYYFVLRQEVAPPMEQELKSFGLFRFARAVMYVMKEMFHIEEDYLLVPPHEKLGRKMLDKVMQGGNFGRYNPLAPVGERSFVKRNARYSLISLQTMPLFPQESVWYGLKRFKGFFEKRILRLHGTYEYI